MKIGIETAPQTFPETYSQHLLRLLREHAPQHEYIFDNKSYHDIDIYHGFRYVSPLFSRLRSTRSVVTVPDLNFLRHPQMFSLFDRMVRIRLYKYSCRAADCVITMNRRAKDELAETLGIDERKIKVMMPLGVHLPTGEYDKSKFDVIRGKYSLPDDYVFTIGVSEPRHNQLEIVDAILESGVGIGLVVCGRKTRYSDFVLRYARGMRAVKRIELVYEPDMADLPALFRMARAFVYIPDAEAEASVLPVVEALRAGIPVVLSDTPLHREAAGDAALYVPAGDVARLAEALRCVLADEPTRQGLIEAGRRRADAFSERAVAHRLVEIYSSL